MIYIYKSSNLAQFLFIKINANLELFILGSKLAQFFLIKINVNQRQFKNYFMDFQLELHPIEFLSSLLFLHLNYIL